MNRNPWHPATAEELESLHPTFQRSARHRGKLPDRVFVIRDWSTLLLWLRFLVGDQCVMEVYPRERDIVNSAPIRWFWVLGNLPEFCDLKRYSA